MIALGANLDQLDKIGRGLGPKIIFTNSGEGISENDFSEGVQCRFSARHHRDFGLKKKIELARKRRFGATRAFGHCLDAAQRLGAPGNDQAGVAKFALAKKNRGRGLHGENLARDLRYCRASGRRGDLADLMIRPDPFLMEGIEMRDHDVELEQDLIASETGVEIAR